MPNERVHVDFMGGNGAQGNVAAYMSAEGRMDVGRLRPYIDKQGNPSMFVYSGSGDPRKKENYVVLPATYATLRRDEWKRLDEVLVPIAESRLRGIQDLVSRGLTYDIGNGMGTTVLEYHDVSDAMEAQLSMDGISRGQNDRPKFTTNYLPLPIIHADYQLNARVLAASRKLGNPLDTTLAERAARRVAEQLENMLFTATTYAYGGGTIYSYLNFPNRNTVTLSTNWDDSAKTPSDIVDDVRSMKQESINAHFYGPWVLYIPTNYETVMDDDYDTSGQSTQTVRERLLKIDGIQSVQVIDTLPDDNVLLVQMTSDVVRLVRGMGIQNVEWSSEGQMVTNYKVMTIQVPQIRADQEGHCGVTHLA